MFKYGPESTTVSESLLRQNSPILYILKLRAEPEYKSADSQHMKNGPLILLLMQKPA